VALLTYDRYVSLTGDTTTAVSAVEARIPDAEQAVSEFLGRPLEYGEYTDRLHIDVDGRVYPKAIPVSSVPASATYQVWDSRCLSYVTAAGDFLTEWPDMGDGYLERQPRADVTYTGGWTAATAPLRLLQAIAQATYGLSNPTPLTDASVGATSVSVGDAAITWEAGKPGTWSGAGQFLERIAPGAPAILADLIWREDYT
jgi:hypothetical protein